MNRREFLNVLAAASAAGFPLASREVLAQPGTGDAAYDLPRFGNVSLLHFTDCHAQLMPSHFREPSVNLGLGAARGKPPHLVGEALAPATRTRTPISISRRRPAPTAPSADLPTSPRW